jgi:hypothetical protein
MIAEDHLKFLSAHQPLPATTKLTQTELDAYDAARLFFLYNPDNRCIPLFLNSFGDGDACGLYQLIPDVLAMHDKSFVLPHLKTALGAKSDSIKYWSAQVVVSFPSVELLPELFAMFTHAEPDLRTAAYIAVGKIGGDTSLSRLRLAKNIEDDELALDILTDIIAE